MELIRKSDAIRAVLHNEGQSAIAAVQAIRPINPHGELREMLIDEMIDKARQTHGANWDKVTADRCKLPTLIRDICEQCRDYKYCHRPITLFDALGKENTDADN